MFLYRTNTKVTERGWVWPRSKKGCSNGYQNRKAALLSGWLEMKTTRHGWSVCLRWEHPGVILGVTNPAAYVTTTHVH